MANTSTKVKVIFGDARWACVAPTSAISLAMTGVVWNHLFKMARNGVTGSRAQHFGGQQRIMIVVTSST